MKKSIFILSALAITLAGPAAFADTKPSHASPAGINDRTTADAYAIDKKERQDRAEAQRKQEANEKILEQKLTEQDKRSKKK